jgi:hypothetical protein
MNTSTLSLERSSEQTVAHELVGRPSAARTASTTPPVDAGLAPERDIEQLIVRFGGPGDDGAIADLERRAQSARPAGALIVAEVDDRLLTAVSLTSGEALSEPTQSGAGAAAIVRYTLASWERQGRTPRRRRAATNN